MEKTKSNHVPVCIICGILTAIGVVLSVIAMINGENIISMINNSLDLVLALLIGYYAIRGYRKPGGNLLKYCILLFCIPFLISVYSRAQKGDGSHAVLRAAIPCLLCYVAGRLHRVKQNAVFMGIVTVVFIGMNVVKLMKGAASISSILSLVLWFDICVAYILRYKEHKLAGEGKL